MNSATLPNCFHIHLHNVRSLSGTCNSSRCRLLQLLLVRMGRKGSKLYKHIKHDLRCRICAKGTDVHLPKMVNDLDNRTSRCAKKSGKRVVKLPFKCSYLETQEERAACVHVMLAVCKDRQANPCASVNGVWARNSLLMSSCLHCKVFSGAASYCRNVFLK